MVFGSQGSKRKHKVHIDSIVPTLFQRLPNFRSISLLAITTLNSSVREEDNFEGINDLSKQAMDTRFSELFSQATGVHNGSETWSLSELRDTQLDPFYLKAGFKAYYLNKNLVHLSKLVSFLEDNVIDSSTMTILRKSTSAFVNKINGIIDSSDYATRRSLASSDSSDNKYYRSLRTFDSVISYGSTLLRFLLFLIRARASNKDEDDAEEEEEEEEEEEGRPKFRFPLSTETTALIDKLLLDIQQFDIEEINHEVESDGGGSYFYKVRNRPNSSLSYIIFCRERGGIG